MNKRDESRIVKTALEAAGFRARVGHGTVTSAWWLYISIDDISRSSEAVEIAQRVTARHGDYDGNINVFTL